MTPAQELQIREAIESRVRSNIGTGRVIPSPLYFNDIADYWRSYEDVDYDTQDELELSNIKFASIHLNSFLDDANDPEHSPLTTFTYGLYLFAQYDTIREDETTTPDPVKRRQLKVYNDFIATIMNLKAAFQGIMPLGLGAEFTINNTKPITVLEEVQNRVQCEYIPQVVGFTMTLGIPVEIQLREC